MVSFSLNLKEKSILVPQLLYHLGIGMCTTYAILGGVVGGQSEFLHKKKCSRPLSYWKAFWEESSPMPSWVVRWQPLDCITMVTANIDTIQQDVMPFTGA